MDNPDKGDMNLNNLGKTSVSNDAQETDDTPEVSGSENSHERTNDEREDSSTSHNGAESNLEENDQSNEVNSPADASTATINELETEDSNIVTTDSSAESADPCSSSSSDAQKTDNLNVHAPLERERSITFDCARVYIEKVEDAKIEAPIRLEVHRNWFPELLDLETFVREWVRSNRRFNNVDGEEYSTSAIERFSNRMIYQLNLFTGNSVSRLDMALREIFRGSYFDVVPSSRFGKRLMVFLTWFANAWGSVGRTIHPSLRRNILVAGGVHQFRQRYREMQVNRNTQINFYPGRVKFDGTCDEDEEEKFQIAIINLSFQNAYQLPIVTVTGSSRSVQSSARPSRGCLRAPVRETSSSTGSFPISSSPSTDEPQNANITYFRARTTRTFTVTPVDESTLSRSSSTSVSLREVDGPVLEQVDLQTMNVSEETVVDTENESVSDGPLVEYENQENLATGREGERGAANRVNESEETTSELPQSGKASVNEALKAESPTKPNEENSDNESNGIEEKVTKF